MNLNSIKSDGFSLSKEDSTMDDIAFISLKIALNSYFSTYQASKNLSHIFAENQRREYEDRNYHTEYFECYFKTIVHFQHFFELTLKEILRAKVDPLLVVDVDKAGVLYKLIKKQNLTQQEQLSLKTHELSRVLNTMNEIIDKDVLGEDFKFIKESFQSIKELNVLRNRLWHRGSYILRCQALDRLIGRFILPTVIKIANLNIFKENRGWRYQPLNCSIDPINEIIKEFKDNKLKDYDVKKIFWLKEMGRAAYNTPEKNSILLTDSSGKEYDYFYRKKVERQTKNLPEDHSHIKKCPVCGEELLVFYEERVDPEPDDPTETDLEKMTYSDGWIYTSEAECLLCSFNVSYDMGELKDYGLPSPNNYWSSKKI